MELGANALPAEGLNTKELRQKLRSRFVVPSRDVDNHQCRTREFVPAGSERLAAPASLAASKVIGWLRGNFCSLDDGTGV